MTRRGRQPFVYLKEAQALLEDYRRHYNHHYAHYRPRGALGYLTPARFVASEAERLDYVHRLSS